MEQVSLGKRRETAREAYCRRKVIWRRFCHAVASYKEGQLFEGMVIVSARLAQLLAFRGGKEGGQPSRKKRKEKRTHLWNDNLVSIQCFLHKFTKLVVVLQRMQLGKFSYPDQKAKSVASKGAGRKGREAHTVQTPQSTYRRLVQDEGGKQR